MAPPVPATGAAPAAAVAQLPPEVAAPAVTPIRKPPKKADPGLNAAIRTGLPAMVKMLVQGGVDVNQPDKDGLTPLGLAARLGRLQCVKILLDSGADISGGAKAGHAPIVEATANKHLYAAMMLLDRGADKKVRSAQGLSLLHIAAEKGSQGLVKLYLRRGLNVNDSIPAGYKLYKHRTPLDFALGSGDLDVVTLLVNSGAKKGQNPD